MRFRQTWIEWFLLGIIAVVCGVLSFFQYRWTGELSRAEPVLLRAGLNGQLGRLAHSLDSEIRESCTTLAPTASEISALGVLQAHSTRYLEWATSHDRSLFKQVGFAVPEHGSLSLYEIGNYGQISHIEWPQAWQYLRPAMEARAAGEGHPPAVLPNSNVIEMPVFAKPASPEGSVQEVEWLIFDLNEEYVRSQLLPRLITDYLNPDGTGPYDVSVNRSSPGGGVLYSTRSDHTSVASHSDATAGTFTGDVGAAPVRRGRSRDNGHPPRWTIAVRHRAGSLDAAVAQALTRNLVASLLLVTLLGGTAWALVRYTGKSRRLSEMQFRFATGVSHDLRTPLTAIRGAAFNLVEGLVHEPSAVQRYLKLILRNSEELTAMIENVLAFSSSVHPGKNANCGVLAVGELLEHASAAMRGEIDKAECQLEVTVASELPAVVGDPIAVELAFRNLIGNAVRHGAEGKWIGVWAVPCEEGVEVRVCDRGPGISSTERERIFEPFYRGEQTRAQRVPGTGLGLSLVKNTIEHCKGTVEVLNSTSGGAQFVVRLPMSRDAA